MHILFHRSLLDLGHKHGVSSKYPNWHLDFDKKNMDLKCHKIKMLLLSMMKKKEPDHSREENISLLGFF